MPIEPFQLGRFRCVHELARGSTAGVYVARFRGLEGFEKVVVLKRIHDHVARDTEFVRRFVADARLGASLAHAGIAKVLECAAERGVYYLASEYVDGISIAQLLTSLDRRGRRLPPPTAAALVMAVSDALDFAHRFTDYAGGRIGVVHAGLRPTKILLPREGGVKVLDFGVADAFAYARRALVAPDWSAFAYLAPELERSEPPTPAADLFSLGAMLYELLTCEPLFLRQDARATLGAVRAARVPRHAALPEPLWELVRHLVAYPPAERVASASDLHDSLARWLAGQRLTPSTAWAMGELRALYSDWAVKLPEEPGDPDGSQDRERRAKSRLASVALARRPAGLLEDSEARDAPQDPYDPLHALRESLEPGSGSFVTDLGGYPVAPTGGRRGPGGAQAPGAGGRTTGDGRARVSRPGWDESDDWNDVATLTEDFSMASESGSPGPDVEDPLGGVPSPAPPPSGAGPSLGAGRSGARALEGGGRALGRSASPGASPGASASLQQRLAELAVGLRELADRRPEDSAVRTHLAGVYRQQGRLDEAESLLTELLGRQPACASGWHQLGLLRQQRGQTDEARAAFERAVAAEPSTQEARLALAAVHLASGAVDYAIATLTAVVALNWRSGSAHRLLARCFLRAGDLTAALEHCEYAASFGEQVGALRREILERL